MVGDDDGLERSHRRLEALEAENALMRSQLGSVLESASWRLTRPLRRIRRSSRPETPPEPRAATAPGDAGQALSAPVPVYFPPCHYYSALVDPSELAVEPRRSQIWPLTPRDSPGLDWRDADQLALCREIAQLEHFEFRADASDLPSEYFALNGQYPPLDAWLLEAMLRRLQPARMIEIGSGFSSLVTARANRDVLNGEMRYTCIEPYPRQFLLDGVPGISDLIVSKIQDVPLATFEDLEDGDILFVDTSHTVKTGGDVTWIFHEIIPRLSPGVMVHVHDAFLPWDYPEPWVLEGWGRNESYLLQSFLTFNREFEIVLGISYMTAFHPDALAEAFPGWRDAPETGGAALWFRRRRP